MVKFLKTLAIVLLISTIIGSFVLADGYYGYGINWAVVLIGVVSAAVLFALFFSIGVALETLNTIRVNSQIIANDVRERQRR